jgi:hypothetical protein
MAEIEKGRMTPTTRAVVSASALLWVAPLIVATSHGSFWERQHSTAPVAAALIFLTVIALLRRHRWAWVLLSALEVGVLVSYAFDFASILGFLTNVAALALLMSPQMRRYVGVAGQDRSMSL